MSRSRAVVFETRPNPAQESLAKLADFLIAEGVVGDISHESLRILLREEGVSLQRIKTWKTSRDPDREPRLRRRAAYTRPQGVRHLFAFAAYDPKKIPFQRSQGMSVVWESPTGGRLTVVSAGPIGMIVKSTPPPLPVESVRAACTGPDPGRGTTIRP